MASAALSKELECSICLTSYTDPVNLRCGHNYCRVCIDYVLDTQEGAGGYFCPECREEFTERPALQRNIALRNIAERFLSIQPDQEELYNLAEPLTVLQEEDKAQEEAGVCCTYCIHSPVPAVMSCLMCEASLCDDHLRVHSKAPEHVLCPPTANLESRKCSVHKEILKYYCTRDSACVCVSCYVIGGHVGHKMISLDEAFEEKKKKLRDDLQKLMAETEEAKKRDQRLQERRRNAQEKAAGETERVTALFRELRRRLEELEKRVLGDIARWAEQAAMGYDEMTRQLEIKKEKLSRKMRHIEELCNMAEPLTVLQEAATGDLCDTEEGDNEDRERLDEELHDGGDLAAAAISHTLHTGLPEILSEVNVCFYTQEAANILLDVTTAGNCIHISNDRKTASGSPFQNHPVTPERFQNFPQVMSSQNFSSGRHYWEVDVGGSECWRVGMCYPSVARRGLRQPLIGGNNKSWCLDRTGNKFSVIHNSKEIWLPDKIPSVRIRIYLNYESGQISFYAMCDPIKHLHTFTATFTEPLHAALGVWGGRIMISRRTGKSECSSHW